MHFSFVANVYDVKVLSLRRIMSFRNWNNTHNSIRLSRFLLFSMHSLLVKIKEEEWKYCVYFLSVNIFWLPSLQTFLVSQIQWLFDCRCARLFLRKAPSQTYFPVLSLNDQMKRKSCVCQVVVTYKTINCCKLLIN